MYIYGVAYIALMETWATKKKLHQNFVFNFEVCGHFKQKIQFPHGSDFNYEKCTQYVNVPPLHLITIPGDGYANYFS